MLLTALKHIQSSGGLTLLSPAQYGSTVPPIVLHYKDAVRLGHAAAEGRDLSVPTVLSGDRVHCRRHPAQDGFPPRMCAYWESADPSVPLHLLWDIPDLGISAVVLRRALTMPNRVPGARAWINPHYTGTMLDTGADLFILPLSPESLRQLAANPHADLPDGCTRSPLWPGSHTAGDWLLNVPTEPFYDPPEHEGPLSLMLGEWFDPRRPEKRRRLLCRDLPLPLLPTLNTP